MSISCLSVENIQKWVDDCDILLDENPIIVTHEQYRGLLRQREEQNIHEDNDTTTDKRCPQENL